MRTCRVSIAVALGGIRWASKSSAAQKPALVVEADTAETKPRKRVIASAAAAKDAAEAAAAEAEKRMAADYKTKLLAHRFPVVALDYDPDNDIPLGKIAHGSGRHVKWRCHVCGHKWTQDVMTRTSMRSPCPGCVNAAATTVADVCNGLLLQEWHPDFNDPFVRPERLRPSEIYTAWWRCASCSNAWQDTVGRRCKNPLGSGCKKCTTSARVAAYARNVGLNLADASTARSAAQKLHFKCSNCGKSSMMVVKEALERGCPDCRTAQRGE